MKATISIRYALRSLVRHVRRTILSITGIGVGCAVCMFMVGFNRGEGEMMKRAAALSGVGHLRVVPGKWLQTRDDTLRLPEWQALRDRIVRIDGVELVAARNRADGLLAFGTRSAGVSVAGVDPTAEPAANRLVRDVAQGRYLAADDVGATVIGREVARRLDVELGDRLMITLSGVGGEMRSEMLTIVGIVRSGSQQLDATICHVTMADLGRLSELPGAGELTILVSRPKELDAIAASLAGVTPPGSDVITWAEVAPELASGYEMDAMWTIMTIGIIVIVVFLGIASAQLAAVLERRREFAVLAALGMSGPRVVSVLFVEALVLGVGGALLGLALGVPLTRYIATEGIDFSAMYGDADLAMANILIDPIIYGDFGWWLLPLAFALALPATMLSSLYPAWFAVRTDPATALRVDQ